MKKFLLSLALIGVVAVSAGCESWEREMKTIKSDLGGGLNRIVEVYDYDGNLLKTYEGKLDVQFSEYGNKVLFDLDGKRVIINNAIVIVEEK